MTFIISNLFQNSSGHNARLSSGWLSQLTSQESCESDLPLNCVLVAENFSLFFVGVVVVCSLMEQTSFCSKIVKKVKLFCMDLFLFLA